jgi:hypothetical protein
MMNQVKHNMKERLIQFLRQNGARAVALATDESGTSRVLGGVTRVYQLAVRASRAGVRLAEVAHRHLTDERVKVADLAAAGRLLVPWDHPEPSRCLISLTGLTHLASAQSRDAMHAKAPDGPPTDSVAMFEFGRVGGKPGPGRIGAQPEWAYKGDGDWVVPPEADLEYPGYALDAGEEGELVAAYLIADDGTPCRVGFAIGNEYSDHELEKKNYLYLAHSKLRQSSFGPELLLGEPPALINGHVAVTRGGKSVWSSTFATGEGAMVHALANLEHHHFKYRQFRRPGDAHVHFFGASALSCRHGIRVEDGDRFEISLEGFGFPLRNGIRRSPAVIQPQTIRYL